jgi:hypothetical protein
MASHASSGTRAVVRSIDAGSSAICVHCDQLVKFSAKVKRFQVICNVYASSRWNRVEHFHLECYQEAGSTHGEVDPNAVPPPRRVQQARDAAALSASTETSAISA